MIPTPIFGVKWELPKNPQSKPSRSARCEALLGSRQAEAEQISTQSPASKKICRDPARRAPADLSLAKAPLSNEEGRKGFRRRSQLRPCSQACPGSDRLQPGSA